jgi:hypothetical protein
MQYTRAQYMSNEVSHEEYYSQFVADFFLRLVAQAFGGDNLRQAFQQDKDFNTIPLQRWDVLTLWVENHSKPLVKEAGDVWSLSKGVCILKQAARMYVENTN